MDFSAGLPQLLDDIELYRTALDSSFDGIHILDCDGQTLYINKACERIEGITMEEARGMNIREMVAQGVYSESVTLKVLETKDTATIIQKVKNGNLVLATGTPITKNGKIEKVVVNSRDVTELNQLRQALSEKENIARQYAEELQLLRMERLRDSQMVVNSPEMKKVERLAATVAKVDSTVLLTGESGVGKGIVGKYIHNSSSRRDGPFIKIDCSAIPDNLFESEVFGYEKGAFTGAEKTGKIGLLELGNSGTVFLDEIGDLPLHMQAKILRAIQDREIIRVGGKDVININVRFIAATNRNLENMVAERTFREDLYYRLNVVPIHIPPLRERKADIVPLVQEVSKKIFERYGICKTFSHREMEAILSFDWPGNVRQLENLIERAMVTEDGNLEVLLHDLSPGCGRMQTNGYKEQLEEFEKRLILESIRQEGSIAKAAGALGMDTTTLRRKLQRMKVTKEEIQKTGRSAL